MKEKKKKQRKEVGLNTIKPEREGWLTRRECVCNYVEKGTRIMTRSTKGGEARDSRTTLLAEKQDWCPNHKLSGGRTLHDEENSLRRRKRVPTGGAGGGGRGKAGRGRAGGAGGGGGGGAGERRGAGVDRGTDANGNLCYAPVAITRMHGSPQVQNWRESKKDERISLS